MWRESGFFFPRGHYQVTCAKVSKINCWTKGTCNWMLLIFTEEQSGESTLAEALVSGDSEVSKKAQIPKFSPWSALEVSFVFSSFMLVSAFQKLLLSLGLPSMWCERPEGNWSCLRTNLIWPGKEMERVNSKNRKGVEKVYWIPYTCLDLLLLNVAFPQHLNYFFWFSGVCFSQLWTVLWHVFCKNRNNYLIPLVRCVGFLLSLPNSNGECFYCHWWWDGISEALRSSPKRSFPSSCFPHTHHTSPPPPWFLLTFLPSVFISGHLMLGNLYHYFQQWS